MGPSAFGCLLLFARIQHSIWLLLEVHSWRPGESVMTEGSPARHNARKYVTMRHEQNMVSHVKQGR